MTTTLLGPQRFLTTAGSVVRSWDLDGPVATVTAGWQDRESDDGELKEVMDHRTRNLGLFARLLDVLDTDPGFAAAALTHREALNQLAGVYSIRLQRALDSVYAVQRRELSPGIADAALADGVRVVRSIDDWYLSAVDQLYGELETAAPISASEPVLRNRAEVAELLNGSAALAIAGGHVGVLLRCLKLFGVNPGPELPVVAWSAGAMALTDRVVLYNDSGQQGVQGAELWDRGLGRARRVVALPHARRRLRMDDPLRLRVLVRRFAEARCLLLDDGYRVDIGHDGKLPETARVLRDDGTVGSLAAMEALS